MDKCLPKLLEQFDTKPGAPGATMQKLSDYVQSSTGTGLPGDYLDFLRFSDGGIGHGPDLYLIMDSAEQVPASTEGYAAEFAPGLIIIGSDGGGNVLGIDTRSKRPESMPYIMVDPIVLSWDERSSPIQVRGVTLCDLLRNVANYYAELREQQSGD